MPGPATARIAGVTALQERPPESFEAGSAGGYGCRLVRIVIRVPGQLRVDLLNELRDLILPITQVNGGNPSIAPDDQHVRNGVDVVLSAQMTTRIADECQVDVLQDFLDVDEA